MKWPFISIIFFILTAKVNATVYNVGADQVYKTPYELYVAAIVRDGDTIRIQAETFMGQKALAVWNKDNLYIQGIGGQPHLVANGSYILGKGIWVLAGNDIIIENIHFSGAKVPDHNGAGIRLDGTGMTVRHCTFVDNENGILTSNPYDGDILIEYCEFDKNGYGDGFSHNLYIGHVNSLTFRYNASHHAVIGHNLKSRANKNYIYYNRIMDESTGNSSRLLDLSNGGICIIVGNILMQGPKAENNNLIGYGLEGLTTNPNELYIVHNTLVNERQNSCIFLAVQSGTDKAVIHNNIFAGTGTLIQGQASSMADNIIQEDIKSIQFIDPTLLNYRLKPVSPAIDAANPVQDNSGYPLVPDKEYLHPTSYKPRRLNGHQMDIGAFEFAGTNYYVSNDGDDHNDGLDLNNPFATIQHAADRVQAGDTVFVSDGNYKGFDLRNNHGTLTNPVVFKARGQHVVLDQKGPIRNDIINIENANHIVIDGFTTLNAPDNGNGIRVVLSNHCIVRDCICRDHAKRGIFTAFTDDILIEHNICSGSLDEHGIYVSNSSDRPVIRYNQCYDNHSIGIHMNGDLSAGSDGLIHDAQIYGNILHDNGLGAGINMDGVIGALVYNNLIYNNHRAQGIALFKQNGAQVTREVKIYNNTIIVPEDGRWGILVLDGANVGTKIYNNIVINHHPWRGSIAIENENDLMSDYNLLNDKMSHSGDGSAIPFDQWQALGFDTHSQLITDEQLLFEDYSSDDYRLADGSQAIDSGTDSVQSIVMIDLLGTPRPGNGLFDIGAYEKLIATTTSNDFRPRGSSLYPNPCSHYLYLEGPKDRFRFSISNVLGSLQLQGRIDQTGKIDIRTLNPGHHIITLHGLTDSYSYRFIKR